MNLLAPVPWLKLLAAGVLFAMGLYVGSRWVQGRWDADRLAQAQAVERILADNAAKARAQEIANEKTITDLHKTVADSDARGTDLAHRLRAYQLRTCPVPKAPDQPGAAPASGEPSGSGAVEQAVADLAAACERDAARLNALTAEVTRQR